MATRKDVFGGYVNDVQAHSQVCEALGPDDIIQPLEAQFFAETVFQIIMMTITIVLCNIRMTVRQAVHCNVIQEIQLLLTNRATRSEVSQGHPTWYHSIC